MPAYTKKKLVHLVSLEDRCKEEQVLVKGEMRQFFRFMSDQISAITSFLEKEINVNRGLRSLLLQKADHYRKKIKLHVIHFPSSMAPSHFAIFKVRCTCHQFSYFPETGNQGADQSSQIHPLNRELYTVYHKHHLKKM